MVAAFVWASVCALVWGIAWFGFMRSAWYAGLAHRTGEMPWTEIWTVWALLNIPLGLATAAYLRRGDPAAPRRLTAAVLVLWIPMTLGMIGWAWYESLSLALIAVDSAVNLVGLALASWVARAVLWGVRGQRSESVPR